MAVFFWQHALDSEFPLAVLEHEVCGTDRTHWHDYLEIALCLRGEGSFRFGRREHPALPGDVFLVDNSEPHAALAGPGGSLTLLLVLFRPELIAAPGCRSFDLSYLLPFRNPDGSSSSRIAGDSPLAREVVPVLLELAETWGRGNPADRHLLDADLRRVLGLVIRQRGTPDAARDPVEASRREQIRPALEFVERHYRDHIELEDVAAEAHLSTSRLRHLMKEVTGVGFREYLANRRLAEAKRMLLSTDIPVADVARAVSYTNLHQFYTVFHRYCGMSPAAYRRQYTPVGARAAEPPEGGTGGAETDVDRLVGAAR